MKIVVQTVAFLLEIAMLISLCYSGFKVGKTAIWSYTLAVLLPGIAIVLWGIWAAPRSAGRLHQPFRLFFELAIFFTAAALLYSTGRKTAALALASIALLTEIAALIIGE